MSSSIRKRNVRKLSFRRYCNRKNEKQPSGCFFCWDWRLGDVRFFVRPAFRLFNIRRRPTPSRCARLPLPGEGASGGVLLVSSFRAKSRNLPCRPINDARVGPASLRSSAPSRGRGGNGGKMLFPYRPLPCIVHRKKDTSRRGVKYPEESGTAAFTLPSSYQGSISARSTGKQGRRRPRRRSRCM